MKELFIDAFSDTLTAVPFLFAAYCLIHFIENYVFAKESLRLLKNPFSPVFAAFAGIVPQCGFAALSSALYADDLIYGGTLIAVFLATSDEAIPLLLAHPQSGSILISLIICKLIIALFWGFLLNHFLFRKQTICKSSHHLQDRSTDKDISIQHTLFDALKHTIEIALFIFIILLMINWLILMIGTDRLQSILLCGSFFQPFFTATLALIPGCSPSVLITELYLSGLISFPAAISGLSSSAGLGYLVLLKKSHPLKNALQIIFLTWLCAVISGMLLEIIY